ncbi:MAG: amino acid ABC transporter permease [Caulobacter sp.]|nr:amino acid ABC transporter permease [Vitreoscilla sp.]
MSFLRSPWPAAWGRKQRSNATMGVAVVGMIVLLWLLARLVALAPEPIGSNAQAFADGARVTVELTVGSGLAGVVLGTLAALGKLSRVPPLRWIAGFYVWVIRGTPLLIQVFFAYFALPQLLPFVKMEEFGWGAVALALNVGAYNAEAIRAGLLVVPKGQLEAARSLGMNRWFTFIDVTVPQAFKISLPALVNNIVSLLKDSSLTSVIGLVELTNVADQLRAKTYIATQPLVASACIYLLLTTVMTHFSGALERRFDIEDKLA